jgi:hypothetical protein
MKRVVVAGGTGFIGRYLVRALHERGDDVTVLARRVPQRELEARVVQYDPYRAGPWYEALADNDAVIQLAGEQAVGVFWTKQKKQRLVESRLRTTEQLVEGLAQSVARPRVFVCASGVGYYGPRAPDEQLDESAPAGAGFLANLCKDWEVTARRAEPLGIRVVSTRFGVVFASGGGALEEMVKPFKLFVGGPIGSGKQVMSWIHIDDLLAAVLRCLDDETIRGPVNVTSPQAATNEELARAIGSALGRPASVRVPAFAMRLRFGEGAEPLLTGQRAVPAVLKERAFAWRHPELASALRAALGAG